MDDATAERWLPVPGYEGFYEVSDLGQVKSLPRTTTRGGILKQSMRGPSQGKRPSVRLSRENAARNWPVHILVLLAFRGGRPPGMHGCHGDDDPMNSRLDNLRWDTPKANGQDKVRNGRTNASLTHCRRGHEFTPGNTWRDKRGHRWCRTCIRMRRNPDSSPAPADRTHCPYGHPYDEANTCVSGGRRSCRTCSRVRARARRAARKNTAAA